jgi:hypothetical protein
MQIRETQGALSLGEVVRGGRLAEAASEDGAKLRYLPELQRLGHGAIIEVSWSDVDGEPSFGLVEVYPDGWGGLSVQEANPPDAELEAGARFRPTTVPTEGWRHAPGCGCPACHR